MTNSVTVDKQSGIKPGSVGLEFGPNPGVGLRVNGVTDGASAALTGQIVEGDMITSINGVDISNMGMAEIMPIIGQSPMVELIIA